MSKFTYLTVDNRQRVLVVGFSVPSLLDSLTINLISEELTRVLDELSPARVVLDFERLDFMSSEMIGKLIAFQQNCESYDVAVKVCNLNESLSKLFKTMKLDTFFNAQAATIAESVNSAW